MKRILKDSCAVFSALLVTIALVSCGSVDQKEDRKYTEMSHDAAYDSLSYLVRPTDEAVLANVQTVKPQKGSRFETVSAQGVINYSENHLSGMSSRVSGRIEHLYVKFNYQAVKKGQKIMDIFSPDLVNAQQELLFLHRNNEPELADMARKKLLLLGITPQQISKLLKTGKVDYTVTVFSSSSGYVVENPVSDKSLGIGSRSTVVVSSSGAGSSSSMSGMGSQDLPAQNMPDVPQMTTLQLKEGMYISKGQTLFKLIDASKVRAEFYIQPDQLNLFKKGIKVLVESADLKDKRAEAFVSMIQPYYTAGISFPLIRVALPNAGKAWKIGELVRMNLKDVKKSGNWLPRSAVLELGNRTVAFVRTNGSFTPVNVEVYSSVGDWVNVDGSIGDREVALNAWFLMDSESFVRAETD